MKIMTVASRALLGACIALLAASAVASDWTAYVSKEYGFSMQIPAGTTTREREWGGGWGGLDAAHEGVKFFGLAKLGPRESDEAIEKFAVKTIGIPASAWTQIDRGSGQQGWIRYRSFQATRGSKLVFGGYGVGAKGSYLVYLETTPADFKEHRADYDKWYASIKLQ